LVQRPALIIDVQENKGRDHIDNEKPTTKANACISLKKFGGIEDNGVHAIELVEEHD